MQVLSNNKKLKMKGGGTFGYTWTEGYGILGKKYIQLNVSMISKEVKIVNDEMNRVVQ